MARHAPKYGNIIIQLTGAIKMGAVQLFCFLEDANSL